jgi:hypothetical protein
MLVKFQDQVFLQVTLRCYVWDSGLGFFRPIDGYGWNGTEWVLDDKAYRKDPLEPTYCFGSATMMAICAELTKKYGPAVETAPTASWISIGTPVWFRDRPVQFTHAAPRDLASWRRLVKGRARSCKRRSTNKFTKRNL